MQQGKGSREAMVVATAISVAALPSRDCLQHNLACRAVSCSGSLAEANGEPAHHSASTGWPAITTERAGASLWLTSRAAPRTAWWLFCGA